MNSEICEWLEKGDDDTARDFLSACIVALYAGEPISEPYATALRERLCTINDAPGPWGVPLLTRPKNRRVSREELNDQWELARLIAALVERRTRVKRAQAIAAEMFYPQLHPDVRLAKAATAWSKHRRQFSQPVGRRPHGAGGVDETMNGAIFGAPGGIFGGVVPLRGDICGVRG